MSDMYDAIKEWIYHLPPNTIVGTTMDNTCCLVAMFTEKPVRNMTDLPEDVGDLTDRFDHLGDRGHGFLEKVEITALQAREIFVEKPLDSTETV